jgi:hypothetical protein
MMQLIAAAVVYSIALTGPQPLAATTIATVVSLSGGALLANLVSVILLVVETASFRRR